MKTSANNETSKDREARIPEGKIYGVFNGDFEALSGEEVIKTYGMPFEEMTDNYRTGVGIFKLPEQWLQRPGKEYGTAKWKEQHTPSATYYYFDR